MGPSGSGKTTLLNMLGGIDQPTQGLIEVDGVSIGGLSGGALEEDDLRSAQLPPLPSRRLEGFGAAVKSAKDSKAVACPVTLSPQAV